MKDNKGLTTVELLLVIIIVVLMTILVAILIFLGGASINSGKESIESTTESVESNTESGSTSSSESTVSLDYTSFIGTWRDNNNNEVNITGIADGSIRLNLNFYRIAYIENITASLNGDTSEFYLINNADVKKVTVKLQNNVVNVDITNFTGDLSNYQSFNVDGVIEVGNYNFTNKVS